MSSAFVTALTSALTGLVTSSNLTAAVSAVSSIVNSSTELKTDATKIMAVASDPIEISNICGDMLKITGNTAGETAAIEGIKAAAALGPSAVLSAVMVLETVIANS